MNISSCGFFSDDYAFFCEKGGRKRGSNELYFDIILLQENIIMKSYKTYIHTYVLHTYLKSRDLVHSHIESF